MAFDAAVARYGLSSDASAAEFLRFIVNFAILAPSGHNTQPWLFPLRHEELQLLADRTRALPVVDPHDRALTISCGAALEHLLRLQFSDPAFRQELAAWIHSRRGATRDGMSGESFGMPDLLSPVGALVIRTFDLGNGVAATDREKIIEGSPVLAVFSSENDEMVDWLATGRALSGVLLTLAAAGATASFLNQPVEVDALRPRLARLAGIAWTPQLLLRFGYAAPAPATVRRPIEEVLVEDDRVAPPSAAALRR